jgi:hypothetical protein
MNAVVLFLGNSPAWSTDFQELAGGQPEGREVGVFLPPLQRQAEFLCEETDGGLEVVGIDPHPRVVKKKPRLAPGFSLPRTIYLQIDGFESGPAWTRTRDLFLIREAL